MVWSRGLLLALSLAPALEAQAQRSAPEEVEAAEEARARSYFTDTELLDQDGRPVRFFSDAVKGRVVCLSFVFSRCSGACPLLAQKLNRVRQDLGDRFGRDVFFVSISVDPGFDTPQQLRRFAERQQALHPGWTFLTGTRAAVQTVLTKLGAWVEEPGDHSTAFIAGNARTRHWTKVRPDLPPGAVAEILRQLADEAPPAEKPVSAATPSAPR
ncbi:MAG TPA: SCO family protein [Anaeromyxobacteraceae bacterium]|nr:SCO family protein [Anaeromyxobacteraceae bacterium]